MKKNEPKISKPNPHASKHGWLTKQKARPIDANYDRNYAHELEEGSCPVHAIW
jgi:hypothetical protein